MSNGIEKNWVFLKDKKLNIHDEEFAIAQTILFEIMSIPGIRLPLKIDKKHYAKRFPNLKHSFIIANTANGIQFGFIAHSKDPNEGIIGHGKVAVTKLVQWQDGSESIVKIEPNKEPNNLSILNNIDDFEGHFVRQRHHETPWIESKGNVKSIKNKQYTLYTKANGITLKSFLENTASITEKDLAEIALNAAKTIQKFQAANLVHCDLHPGNLMIDANKEITLIDFGTLNQLKDNQQFIHLGKPVGSRNYMPPEVGVWEGGKNSGYWKSREGNISLSSDIYSLGKILERKLNLKHNSRFTQLIKKMTDSNPLNRPNIDHVVFELENIHSAYTYQSKKTRSALTISVGQALLLLVKHYQSIDPEYSQWLKHKYVVGFKTEDDREKLQSILKDPVLKSYYVSDNYNDIASDPTRRYFETHLSFETMKSKLKDYPTSLIQAHYDSIKSCFENLGGDIDFQKFKKTGQKVLLRNYEKEKLNRAQKNVDPNDLIKGLSIEEQKSLDKLFSGTLPDKHSKKFNDPMYMEYCDMIKRIKESTYLNNDEKQKALLIVKTTRLSMILGKKMEKYKEKGTYTGDLMPGEYIFKSAPYIPENRGRLDNTTGNVKPGSHNMGLLQSDMPLDKTDEAYSDRSFPYVKPSEKSTFHEYSPWVRYAMDQKVHTFSNALSGTLLAQLRCMMKLHQEGKLIFKNKDELAKHFTNMISLMTYMTGGHSLLEFTAPLQLRDVVNEFNFIPNFKDLSLESLFYTQNKDACEQAIKKTIQYNDAYMEKTRKEKEQCLYQVPHIECGTYLAQFKSYCEKHDPNAYVPKAKLTHYTHLNPKNIRQDIETLMLMEQATHTELSELAIFKPSRALLHEAAAFVTSCVQSENEQDRNRIIHNVVNALSPTIETALNKGYVAIKKIVEQYIAKIMRGENAGNHPAYKKAIELARKVSLPSAICPRLDTVEKLAVEIACASLFKEKQSLYIADKVEQYFKNSPHTLKKSPVNGKPVVMFVAGAQGSGKGGAVAGMLSHAQQRGIDPKNVVYLNNDSYKPLLLDATIDKQEYSQLTHEEATLIRKRALTLAENKKMHLLLDQVSPSQRAACYAQDNGGMTAGMFISTNVDEALERAFLRGKETGRFEDTQSVLKCHQEMPKKALAAIIKNKNTQSEYGFYDNSDSFNKAPKLFMRINQANKLVEIHDKDLLLQFIKKQFINPSAKKFTDLYKLEKISDSALSVATNDWLDKLYREGYTINLVNQQSSPRSRMGAR